MSNDSSRLTRRGLLALTGAAAVSGCVTGEMEGSASTQAATPEETETRTETPTEASTATEDPETFETSIPESTRVGEPLTIKVTGSNPGGGKETHIRGVSVVDVEAAERWSRTFQVRFDEGETETETTWEIDWGTHHETTLLVNAHAGSMSILGGEGFERTDSLTRVEVTR